MTKEANHLLTWRIEHPSTYRTPQKNMGMVWVNIKPPARPQVLGLGSIYQGNPFWGYPVFYPQPNEVATECKNGKYLTAAGSCGDGCPDGTYPLGAEREGTGRWGVCVCGVLVSGKAGGLSLLGPPARCPFANFFWGRVPLLK